MIMQILKEFKDFAMRGNVIDMAVGIIIGASFGKITSSLVGDVLMPPVGVLVGGVDFSKLAITIRQATLDEPEVLLKYGMFINTLIDFTIVAFAMFMIIKGINSLKKKEAKAPAAPPAPTTEQHLLMEIRDLLKHK